MSPILMLMLKSPVGRTQVLRWSPAFVLGHIPGGCASCFAHGRCTGPQVRARVLYLRRSNRMFCSSCGAMLSLLLRCRLTPSLCASLLDCELACSGLPLLGAESSTGPCLLPFSGRPAAEVFPSVSQRSVRYSVAYRLYAYWPLALL